MAECGQGWGCPEDGGVPGMGVSPRMGVSQVWGTPQGEPLHTPGCGDGTPIPACIWGRRSPSVSGIWGGTPQTPAI